MDAARQIGGEDQGQGTPIRRIVGAVLIGSVIEWYDFFVYGIAAALILNTLFFPSFSPTAGTLLAFVTFAVGWFARPIGGLIGGHFGDKIGRKAVLVLTMLLMGIATFAIGLLPTYASIGVWAPILLTTVRLLQGLAVGGEWGGAVLLAVEHAPDNKRGFYGSWPQMGVPAGLLLGTSVFTLCAAMLSDEQFAAWGWRIPFLLSIVLVAVGLYIRLRVLETPAFTRMQETQGVSRAPAVDAVRNVPGRILLVIIANLGSNVLFYTFGLFVLSYATAQLGMSREDILLGVILGAAVDFFAIPAWAALSDRIGRRPVFIGGYVFAVLYMFPFYWLLDTQSPVLAWIGIMIGFGIAHASTYGAQASFFAELFPPRVRYTGISLGYQLSGTLGGAPFPIIATALVAVAGGSAWLLALYSIVIAVVSLIAVYLAPETFREAVYLEAPRKERLETQGQATE